MKLGVTTLGCPTWTLDEILARLPGWGYDGVELRGLGPDLDLTQSPHFATPAAIQKSRGLFANAGLELCALDTSCTLSEADPASRAQQLDDGRRGIDLAAALGIPFVRVFGGGDGQDRVEAARRVADALDTLGDYAASAGSVAVTLETHDAFSTGRQAAEALVQVTSPAAGALWDLHHPYRQGESPAETFAALAPYLRTTHVKDSLPGGTYCLLGDGDVPIPEMLGLLAGGGYDGWITLEWEKRWIPALLDPDIAFPQYAAKLREYLAALTPSH